MEYEMESETVLFDPSTNPSLDRTAFRFGRDRRRQDKKRPQRGVMIPDEDDQAA